MKITEVKNLHNYLIGSIPIGVGTTAICFLMKNNKVLKLYYSEYFKKIMISKLKMFENIGNDSYIAPEEVLIRGDECIAQIYPYISAHTLHSIRFCTTLNDILRNYDKLVINTKDISKKSFMLGDLHDRNILFNGSFYVIDLDRGYVSDKYTDDIIFMSNMRKINETILYSLLGVRCDRIINFCDQNIQKLYSNSLSNFEEFPNLLEQFGSNDENIKRLSKKIKYETFVNTYYKY